MTLRGVNGDFNINLVIWSDSRSFSDATNMHRGLEMADEEGRARNKKAFFDKLYNLDNEDERVDESLAASRSFRRPHLHSNAALRTESMQFPKEAANTGTSNDPDHATKTHHRRTLQIQATPAIKLIRSVTAPTTGVKRAGGHEVNIVADTPAPPPPIRGPAKLRHTVSSPSVPPPISSAAMASSGVPKALGKRKRDSISLAPEHQRIFKDLVFYFFPNNDVDKARRARIAKTIEYGATWAKDWQDGITHAIVDASLNYRDLCKYTGFASIPEGIAVVNERYPADCLIHRCMLDVKQLVYEVPGHKIQATDSARNTPSENASQTSLPLKPAKGNVVVHEPQTPSRTDESSNQQPAAEMPAEGRTPEDYNPSRNDPLGELINEARAMKHLPLDQDDDVDVDPDGSGAQLDSDEEGDLPRLQRTTSNENPSWQKNFHCMQKHDPTTDSENPNGKTIEILQEMANYYDRVNDSWRTMAYRKAIGSLRKQSRKITTKEEALALPFVGARLAAKVEEIVITNRLRRLDAAILEPSDQILQTFVNIYGVGYHQASRWVSQGYKTLADLLARASLSDNQRIGIAHYDDFLTRIPRAEVAQHGAIVRHLLHSIDPAFQVIVGGSYRRGATSSGDIDLIITKPNTPLQPIRNIILETVIPQLTKQNFLRASLGEISKDSGSQLHAASCLPGSTVWRRIDLLLVPWDQMGGALIYYTGNDIFNRSIRLLASKKGMRLNQRGLYKDVIRGRNREKINEGTLVEGRSEKRIFEILGVPWRPPEHRNC